MPFLGIFIRKYLKYFFLLNLKSILMKNLTFASFLLLLSFIACTPADPSGMEAAPTTIDSPASETEKAITQAVLNAYAAISFPKGETPDYDALRAIFTEDAVLQNYRNDTLESFSINDFVTGFKAGIDSGEMTAFQEEELGGKTEYFGKIGHRISAYASYFEGSSEIGEKGVNSFQLLKENGQWLVSAIIWDVEKEGQAIPEKYIKK